MAEDHSTDTITPCARYYRLHRDEQLIKKKEAYNQRPDVIAKREEREMKRSEREAENAIRKLEKERKIQERITIAEKTKRKFKKILESPTDAPLESETPAR